MEIKDWIMLGGAVLLYLNREKLKEALNPASNKNVANQTANAITQALTGDPNATLGTKAHELKQALVNPDQKYLGYPSRYNTQTGVWQVLVDGKWIVDDYMMKQAKQKAAATAKPTASLRRKGKTAQWEKYLNGRWQDFSAADYNTYRAIVGPTAGPAVPVMLPPLLNASSPVSSWLKW